MTRTREELAAELERRVGFLRELRDGTGHEGKATLATQMAHAADVGWTVERSLATILAALREPQEPAPEKVERLRAENADLNARLAGYRRAADFAARSRP